MGCPARPKAGAAGQTGPKKKPPPVNATVQVGRAGVARDGVTVPIRVTLGQNEKAIVGKLVLDDLRGGRTEAPFDLPRNGNKQYTLFAALSQVPESRNGESAELSVTEGGRVLARQTLTPVYPTSTQVVLSATGDGSGLQFLDDQRAFRVEHLAPVDLPREWAGFFPADVVAVNGRAWSAMDDAQRRALRMWVEMGGHALLCGESPLEWRDPEAAALVGVTPARPAPGAAGACLAAWGDAPYVSGGGAVPTVTGPLRPGARVLFGGEAGATAAVRRALRGRVVWLGFDAFRQSIRTWPGNEVFWRRALTEATRAAEEPPVRPPEEVEEARLAATALPRLPAPPLAALLAFGAFYAVVFGPLNILVLRRLRRTVRAWLFVPSLALGMTLVVLFAGQLWGNARTVLNSVTLLHAAAGGRTAREETLVGLFTPTNRAFDLSVDDTAPRLADAGSADPRDEGVAAVGWPRFQSDGIARWDALPLVLYSTRLLRLDRPRDLNGSVEARLDWSGGAPRGDLTNGTGLVLRGAHVYYQGRVHWLGDLAAGGRAPVRRDRWARALPGAPAGREAAAPAEVAAFRGRMDALWRRAGELTLAAGARQDAWLIAECGDWRGGGLTVAQVPYSNQAALLLVRLPRS
jgi:hypothetical protein